MTIIQLVKQRYYDTFYIISLYIMPILLFNNDVDFIAACGPKSAKPSKAAHNYL